MTTTIELSDNTLSYLHNILSAALRTKMKAPFTEQASNLIVAFTEITTQITEPLQEELLTQVEDWVAGKLPLPATIEEKKEEDNSFYFPSIVRMMIDKNIRLHLDGCKTHISQIGRMSLVSPEYGGGYFGVFEEDGTFKPRKECRPEFIKQLCMVEQDGIEALKKIGKATGNCCVCGRLLTAEGSIEDGIGPICAGRLTGGEY